MYLAADLTRTVYGCRALYHADPTVWNSALNDSLKLLFSAVTSVTSALDVF